MTATREMPVTLDDDHVAYVEGTTTKVIEIVVVKQEHGLTPEEVQRELPHLTLAQIYGAMAYYHAHKSELDLQIDSRYRFAETLLTDNPNLFTRETLQARRNR